MELVLHSRNSEGDAKF